MEGRVIKNISNDYVVKSGEQIYLCKARGKFRKLGIVPMVGDFVSFDEKQGYLLKIMPRKNSLIRPNVANVDQAVIVSSVKSPNLDTYLLDKLLTIISFHHIEPIICFTKLDLLNLEEREQIYQYIEYYQRIGYQVVTNESRENLISLFQGKVSVLAGQSGAGKSSLLNLLDSSLNLKTDQISYALNRGKHTTRHTELYELLGGYVVDTPGFSSIDFREMEFISIRDNMKEMFDALPDCKYRDCMHIKEDGCQVKHLVEEGIILPERYEHYLRFIKEKNEND